jgi:hypothetical protein
MPPRRARSWINSFLAIVTAGVLALSARSAAATDPSVVVLLEPAEPDAVARETLTRAKAELSGAGFRVIIAPRGAGDPRGSLETAIREAGAIAAIAIEPSQSSSIVEVWVSDRLTGKLSIRPVESPRKGEAPALLAIRAVELLRASLLEIANPPTSSTKNPAPPPEVTKLTEPAVSSNSESRRAGFGIEAGMMGFLSVDGIHPAVAPMFRASYGVPIGLGARVTWAGPSFGPGLDGELGQAVITQYLALAELVYSPPLGGPVALLFNGGLGGYHVSASGELFDPQRARSGGSTAFIATWGAGLDFRIHRRFGLALETMAGVSAPRVTIEMGSEEVGHFGRPLLGASLGAIGLF